MGHGTPGISQYRHSQRARDLAVAQQILFEDIFVMSDVHLAESREPRLDESLCGFFDHHVSARSGGRQATVILNGDFIDFVRVLPQSTTDQNRRLGSTQAQSVAKFARCVEWHRPVFKALQRFLGQGNQIIAIAGNHDVDLFWPEVRRQFCKETGQSERLHFCDGWSLSERGIYVEHGHQHSYDNRFERFPPFDTTGEYLERPWGTFFMDAIYNRIESFAPWIGMVYPHERAIALALKHRGWDAVPPVLIPEVAGFFMAHGKRVVMGHMLGEESDPNGDSIRAGLQHLGANLAHLPWEIQLAAEKVARQQGAAEAVDPDIERPIAGTMGRTDDRGIGVEAGKRLTSDQIHSAIFGHTHRPLEMSARQGAKVMINTGTWSGQIDLENAAVPSFEWLNRAAAEPSYRPTYAYVGPSTKPAVLEPYAGAPG